jgi:similar to stage IV sporulation protein
VRLSDRWRVWWRGWLQVALDTTRVGDVLTDLWAAGATLWGIRAQPDGVHFYLPYRHRRALTDAARSVEARRRVLARGGFPLWWRRARRRAVLALSLLLAVGAVMQVSSRIWVVDVSGVPPALQPRVLAAVTTAGLRPGAVRRDLDTARVEAAVLSQVPGVSWAGVRIFGGLVIVRVHALNANRPPPPAPRLVARVDGVVRRVAVYAGSAAVAPGDRVRRGQTLIVGNVIVPPAELNEGAHPPAQAVAAGAVLADVTVRAQARVPYRQPVAVETGRAVAQEWVTVGSWSALVGGFAVAPYPASRVQTVRTPLYWRGVRLPVTLVRVVYNQTIVKRRVIRRREALQRAMAEAWRRVRAQWVPGAQLVSQRVTVEWGRQSVDVTIVAVTRENIVEPAPLQTRGGT